MQLRSDESSDNHQDLLDCASEPIHIPGAIQPHGLLVVVNEDNLQITQVSDNAEAFTDKTPAALIGTPFSNLLKDNFGDSVLTWIRQESPSSASLYEKPVLFKRDRDVDQQFYLIAHTSPAGYVIEFEAIPDNSSLQSHSNALLESAIDRLNKCNTLKELYELAVSEIKTLTGFARVKCYQFDKEWHGQVIAEAREDFMPSYLGLHFPAGDIPVQARKLYTINRTRLISSVKYTPAQLVPQTNPATEEPLNLSHSSLRSVSPIHLEYLANMDVNASMSISIIHENNLWGLFACHHHEPLYVPYPVRMVCTILGQILAMMIETQISKKEEKISAEFKEIQSQLLKYMIREKSYMHGLTGFSPNLIQATHASGAAIVREQDCICLGKTPKREQTIALCQWLSMEQTEDKLFHTDRLSELYAPAKEFQDTASGVIAYCLSKMKGIYILWFKPEEPEIISWAGNPTKTVQRDNVGVRLHPRLSFDAWKELKRGRSKEWTSQELSSASNLCRAIMEVVFVKIEEIEKLNHSLQRANQLLNEQNQELRKYAFDTIREPHIVLNTDLRIVSVNRSFARHFNVNPEVKIQRKFTEIFEGAWDNPELESRLKDALENGTPVDNFIISSNFPKLGNRINSITIRLIDRPVDSGEHLLLAIQDVTESVKAKQERDAAVNELQSTNEKLQLRNKEIQQFTYMVSHDLKSPIVTIQGFSKMLKTFLAEDDPDKLQDAIHRIQNAATHMSQLVDDLLNLSRIGNNATSIKRVDVQDLVQRLIQNLQIQLNSQNIELNINAPLPAVDADPKHIQALFDNFITNAIKYGCSKEEGHIEIGAQQAANEVIYYVKDNGPGIDPDDHNQIFNMFERLESEQSGTGIGLAIVAKIMKLYQGKAWVESVPGQGATFKVAFPV